MHQAYLSMMYASLLNNFVGIENKENKGDETRMVVVFSRSSCPIVSYIFVRIVWALKRLLQWFAYHITTCTSEMQYVGRSSMILRH